MAQLVLTLAGGALGQAVGGAFGQGLGALFGATIGGILDQQLFGPQTGRQTREEGKVTDVRLSGSAYGLARPNVYGRGRIPANIIWARGIREEVRTTTETVGGGGKGGGGGSQTVITTSYRYYADVALGLGEGPLTSVYRIWVDGQPIDSDDVDEIRIYYGDEAQGPDPLIQAVEGADRTPAFRGTAYVVLENLYLTAYGNRFPNFEIEVFRGSPAGTADARHLVESVCLIPASGEFAYDPDVVFSNRHSAGTGFKAAINAHAGQKRADFTVAIDNMRRELPNVEWVSLVYAWFGTSLDVATCSLRPECETGVYADQVPESYPHVWSVAGIGRPLFGMDGDISGLPHWPMVSSYTNPDGSLGLYYGGTIADGVVTERKSIRDMIAVLQTAFFFDCVERDGKLVFVKRGGGGIVAIDAENLGASDSDSDRSRVKIERTQDTELPIAVDVVHIDEGRDYQSSTVTIRKQVGRSDSVTTFSLPIVLSVEQAQTIGQRALREMWQGREAIDLRLPTRGLKIDPTDVVEVPVDGVLRRYRVTSVTYGKPGLVLVRGQATDGGNPDFVSTPTGSGSLPPSAPEPVSPVRIELLDMPILVDGHEASSTSFYMAACPLGGGRFRGASLFQPTADGLDYVSATVATLASIMGATVTDLSSGPVWTWDRGNSVEVQLYYGTLQSLPDERVLAGSNAALIGDEIIQFATAELIAAGRYRLSRLLRGQRGTEGDVATHPAGSRFIMLDPARQVRPSFSVARLGLTIAYRGAPVPEGPAGEHALALPFANGGRGLKPFAPAQLKARRETGGDVHLSWIRRSRIGGDSWFAEVPLGEEAEEYDVTILSGSTVLRTTRVTNGSFVYAAAQQAADFGAQPATLKWRVAQVSRVFGPGRAAEITSTL